MVQLPGSPSMVIGRSEYEKVPWLMPFPWTLNFGLGGLTGVKLITTANFCCALHASYSTTRFSILQSLWAKDGIENKAIHSIKVDKRFI